MFRAAWHREGDAGKDIPLTTSCQRDTSYLQAWGLFLDRYCFYRTGVGGFLAVAGIALILSLYKGLFIITELKNLGAQFNTGTASGTGVIVNYRSHGNLLC